MTYELGLLGLGVCQAEGTASIVVPRYPRGIGSRTAPLPPGPVDTQILGCSSPLY